MNRYKIMVVLLTAGMFDAVFAHGLFLLADLNNATKRTNITTSLIPQKEGAWCRIGENKEHDGFEAAIKRVRDKIAKAHKSESFPRQCLLYSGTFELNGHEFAARAATNQNSVAKMVVIEDYNTRNLHMDGRCDLRIDITQIGGGAWDAYLCANYHPEDAMEIAISSFFSQSSMTEERIVESITVELDKVGDVCLSWRQESCRKTFMVFIKGGCVVVIRGNINVAPVATLLDCILGECGQAYEKGEIITIATAAERLLKRRNSEGVHSAASERSTEGTIR